MIFQIPPRHSRISIRTKIVAKEQVSEINQLIPGAGGNAMFVIQKDICEFEECLLVHGNFLSFGFIRANKKEKKDQSKEI